MSFAVTDLISICAYVYVCVFVIQAYISSKSCSREMIQEIVHSYSLQLQMQERLTNQIACALEKLTNATGVMVYTNATHMCMLSRGVRCEGCNTTTVVTKGTLSSDRKLRKKILENLQ